MRLIGAISKLTVFGICPGCSVMLWCQVSCLSVGLYSLLADGLSSSSGSVVGEGPPARQVSWLSFGQVLLHRVTTSPGLSTRPSTGYNRLPPITSMSMHLLTTNNTC